MLLMLVMTYPLFLAAFLVLADGMYHKAAIPWRWGAVATVLASDQPAPRALLTAWMVAITKPNWKAKPCVTRPEPCGYGPPTCPSRGDVSGSSSCDGAWSGSSM
jgi:hypothetical protein